MFYIHHFAHHETMLRACDWLGRFGFAPDRRDGSPWLSLRVEPGQMHEVEMLVNAAEMSDPQGWPSFWDEAKENPFAVGGHRPIDDPAAAVDGAVHRLAIRWHPVDEAGASRDPEFERICEAMGH